MSHPAPTFSLTACNHAGIKGAMVNEETVFVSSDLPADLGRDWEWHGSLNLVELRSGMTAEERLAALDDLQRWWRRAHLRAVESA